MAKGAAYERELCKMFSKWWTDGKRDDIFWRTSNSGGRATMRKKKSTYGQHGDMGFIDPIGKPLINLFTFEFKRGYQQSTLQDFLDRPFGNKTLSNWEKWIYKAMGDCRKNKSRTWIIIHKRNNREPYIVMPYAAFMNVYPKVQMDCFLFDKLVPQFRASILIRKNSHAKRNKIRITSMLLDDFLKAFDPELIKEHYQ